LILPNQNITKKKYAKNNHHSQSKFQSSAGEKWQKLGTPIKSTCSGLMTGSVEKPDLVYLKPNAL
jgi:hypothetical protein